MDMNVVIKRLEEAGIYEQSLKKDEMIAYYNAIKDSEDSALVENNMRRHNESACSSDDDFMDSSPPKAKVPPFTPKQWVCDKTVESDSSDVLIKEVNNSGNMSISESSEELVKVNIVKIDIEDKRTLLFAKLGEGNLLKDSEFSSKTLEERAVLLFEDHNERVKELARLARESLHFAPLPKIITASNSSLDIFESKNDIESTYISRSGRQTKRKNYSYNEITYEDYISETDDAILSTNKKTKLTERIPKISKKTLSDTPTSTTKTPSTSVLGVLDTETPKSDYRTKRRLTNEEIIKRSPLFADPVKSTRKDLIIEKARQEDEKKKKSEMEFDRVMASIDDEEFENKVITIDDKSPVKRRVIPKCPIRKRGIGPKKDTIYDISEEPSTSSTPSTSATSSTSVERIIPIQMEDASSSVPTTTTNITTRKVNNRKNTKKSSEESEASELIKVGCPICGKDFPKDVIMEHASECEFQVETTQVEEVHSTLSSKRIMCEICDRVFPLNTNYEVHISECLAEKKRSISR
ncbi:unnamed protein product [Brassicogethes aeneus]|uniref:UBZ4-type domain-containing protein n=1 Tax=Brassicogethes aeneus TaxID=1431903 RepID=A0A9P0FE46_BRAAE|nr:unnamed protein product [Brassicogethes aeneus]